MRGILTAIAVCLFASSATANPNNEKIKWCVQNTSDYREAAACYQDWKDGKRAEEYAELRDFLKHNPRYRYPGQSLNKCFGKPREMPFESSGIEVGPSGYKAWVNYKDKIPAGCYETAPWDNRDVED